MPAIQVSEPASAASLKQSSLDSCAFQVFARKARNTSYQSVTSCGLGRSLATSAKHAFLVAQVFAARLDSVPSRSAASVSNSIDPNEGAVTLPVFEDDLH